MRGVVAVIVVMLLGAKARADSSFEHTRAVVAKHAHRAHKVRMIAGVSSLVLGTGAVVGGAYIIHETREGGFIDLSAIDYLYGYTFVGTGSVGLAFSGLLLWGPSPVEDLHDALEDTVLRDGAQVDAVLDAYERREHGRRRVLRGVGLGLAATGLATIGVVAWGPPSLSTPLGRGLATGGAAATYAGGVLVLATVGPSVFEKIRDDDATTVAPVIAPARGGGLVGFAGAF